MGIIDVNVAQQQVVDYLKNTMGFELIVPSSGEVSRILDKLEIHDMSVSAESIQHVIDEYEDEVMHPIKAVVFDDY